MQSDCSDRSLKLFLENLGFKNFSEELVNIAFTHSSFTKEKNLSYLNCYERLEFFGDAVLKLVVTEYLYNKYPDATEGFLTKIRGVVVSDEILHKIATKIGIEPYIKLSDADYKAQSYKLESIQACVMEALFGAIYLSGDINFLKNFIVKNLESIIEDIANNKTVYNAKAILQEYTQQKTKDLPEYKLVSEFGEAHNKSFVMSVSYKGQVLGEATAKTKKAAQQEAAFQACIKLGLIKNKVKDI